MPRSRSRSLAEGDQPTGPSQRQLRVGEALRHALAEALARGDLRDPALAERSITVGEVRVSPDLRHATAFVMPLGGADAAPILAALRRAAPYLRTVLARGVQLRFAPEITFTLDRSFEEAERIERALKAPHIARDLGDDTTGA